MVPDREEEPDEFAATLEGVAHDVLAEVAPQSADDHLVKGIFLAALGRALASRGLKIAQILVVESEIRDGSVVLARARVVLVFFDPTTQRATVPVPAVRDPLVAFAAIGS